MIYIVEIWNTKPAWLELSLEERGNYMTLVGNANKQLMEQGVKILTWSLNDAVTAQRCDYDYFAIWAFPDQTVADSFLKTVEGAGWYNYFEQVNLMGAESNAEQVIGQLVQL